jgi:hypothetical protein
MAGTDDLAATRVMTAVTLPAIEAPVPLWPASLGGQVRSEAGAGIAALVVLVNRRGEVVCGTRAYRNECRRGRARLPRAAP